jgi:gliding motility-associated-like protein
MGFPFSFYGITYNQLIASTNGFISFDISKNLTFSHFGILKYGGNLSSTVGIPEDLPSSLYDKALIMGAYQDIDPNNTTLSHQIKYEVIGSAPYRKWILSYYNVPLYTNACQNLRPVTQQIVLYETVGIIEIFIYDKEICLNWNYGRSMIGLQDYNKTSAIMAPARQATSAPWGSQSMNESWRFVPAAGSSLFKRVELYTLSGAFVSTGSTTTISNNLLEVNIDNVCPPAAGETYLVKSFYDNPNNPSSQITNIDTINISRGEPISVDITAGCAPGSTGTVTVTSPLGTSYQYSIDGINWQTSTQFNLPIGGTYKLRSRIIGMSCTASKNISVIGEPLTASVQTKIIPCPGPPSATISIFPSHGTAPYIYSLNGAAFQSSNIYSNLTTGTYQVLIKDGSGCSFSQDVYVSAANSATAFVTNTACGTDTGSITVTPSFGTGPYTYTINGGTSQSSNIFKGLSSGIYNITVNDASSCSYSFSEKIMGIGTISAKVDLVTATCYGNTNGGITVHATSGTPPYKFALNSGVFQTDSVFRNLGSASYIVQIVDASGCENDTAINLYQPNEFKITAVTTLASTCLSPDGEIFVKANGGTTPYYYSIDNGITYSMNNIFTVKSGTYLIVIKDSNGCTTKGIAVVGAKVNNMSLELGPDKTVCFGDSVSLAPLNITQADSLIWSPAIGLNDTISLSPKASPADTTKYYVTAKLGSCERKDSIGINILHKPIPNAGKDTIICNNTTAILYGSVTNTSGDVKYLWYPSTEVTDPYSPITAVSPNDIKTNTYFLQVTDTYGCNFKVIDKVNVTMNPPVLAFAGNDTVASAGVPLQLYGSGGIKYLWSPANVLNNPIIQNPIAVLTEDTKFNLIVRDTLGCTGTSSVTVKVYKGTNYYVPNAFTPNGDGLNDVFKAIAPGIQVTDHFRIFNRWGKLLFETRDARKGWDGTYLGVPQPTGVYVWMIRGINVSQKLIELKGTVTLVR